MTKMQKQIYRKGWDDGFKYASGMLKNVGELNAKIAEMIKAISKAESLAEQAFAEEALITAYIRHRAAEDRKTD